MRTFGETLRHLRKQKDITQEVLGNILGVAKSTVAGWENTSRLPEQVTINKICDYFNVTLDYIMGRSDFPKGRLVTREELQDFLPDIAIKKIERDGINFQVNDIDLDESTKRQIMELLKQRKYL